MACALSLTHKGWPDDGIPVGKLALIQQGWIKEDLSHARTHIHLLQFFKDFVCMFTRCIPSTDCTWYIVEAQYMFADRPIKVMPCFALWAL